MPDDFAEDQIIGPYSEDCADIEVFLAGILNSLEEHVAVIDQTGAIISVNEAWRNFARENDAKSPKAVSSGANYLDICRKVIDKDKSFAHEALEGIEKVLGGAISSFSMEYPCNSPNEERWFIMNAVPLRRSGGGAVITHTNITRRILAERKTRESEQRLRESREEYRQLTRRLLAAREDASRRLARELHDSFGQRLAMVSMLASRIEIDCAEESSLDGLKRIKEELSKLSVEAHNISRQLHPSIIEDLGLADAVASFCTNFTKNEGIPVKFAPGKIPDSLGRETALNLYRVTQESLNNAAKHSKAENIEVGLEADDGMIRLSITDDGVGFDPDAVRAKHRLGLISLRERASLIGGSIDISSSPGAGTTVKVEAPLEPVDER